MKTRLAFALITTFAFPVSALAEPMTLEEAVTEIRRQAAEMKLLKEKLERLERSKTEQIATVEKPLGQQKNSLDVSARITFLKPTLNDFDLYGGVNVADNVGNNGSRITTTDTDLKSLEYGYNTGFEITSAYKFANSGWGVEFEYSELNASTYSSENTSALGGGRINTLHNVEIDDTDTNTIYGDSTLYAKDWKLGGSYTLPLNNNFNFSLGGGFQAGTIDATLVSRDEGEVNRDNASASDGTTGNFSEYSTVVSNLMAEGHTLIGGSMFH